MRTIVKKNLLSRAVSWEYVTCPDNTIRYVLGKKGTNPLLCIGVNPSSAYPHKLDGTLQSVDRLANNNGFDGWMMLNIYPIRATNPNDLPSKPDETIHQTNLIFIRQMIELYGGQIWAAWGTLIEKRDYLLRYLKAIYELTHEFNCEWWSLGKISKKGHPHHPLYLKSSEAPQTFDIKAYLELFVT